MAHVITRIPERHSATGLKTAGQSAEVLPVQKLSNYANWVVVKIMVPSWLLSIVWHLVCRGPKRGP